jgi:ribosomal protein S18 acetylase RimI-like enzyme
LDKKNSSKKILREKTMSELAICILIVRTQCQLKKLFCVAKFPHFNIHFNIMIEIKIRKASIVDLGQLLVFEQDLIKTERPFDPSVKPDPVNYYDLKAMLTDPQIEMVVGELNNKVIASGYARIDKSKPYLIHSHHAYLGFMYVLPGYRGQGINKKIMDVLKDWAASQNITEFRLDVYYDNASAIKAYEKVGFSRYFLEMRFNLEDEKK